MGARYVYMDALLIQNEDFGSSMLTLSRKEGGKVGKAVRDVVGP